MTNVEVYERVTKEVLRALEGGTVPWQRPWDPEVGLPRSLSTGKPYRGINTLLLGLASSARGYDSPWWGTYHQVQQRGGQVRTGERSTLVLLWKPIDRRREDPSDGAEGQGERGHYLLARAFNVFNANQCDRLGMGKPSRPPVDPIQACEQLVAGYLASGPALIGGIGRAWYSPSRDVVGMPELSSFHSQEEHYSTLFHELTHSTGHVSRLSRDGIVEGHRWGDEVYSREELVAEMGAAMLCGLAGIEQITLPNSAAYIGSWLGVLRGDPKLVVSAAAAAQRAADLIAGQSVADLAVAA
jgi:antirestriction protein ArdC